MSLQLSKYAKRSMIELLFGRGDLALTPAEAGTAGGSGSRPFYLALYDGDIPDLADMSIAIADAGNPPSGTSVIAPLTASVQEYHNANPFTNLEVSWEDISVATDHASSEEVFNLLSDKAGTLSWFAFYANLRSNSSSVRGLHFIGTIGEEGSGADLIVDSVNVPSEGTPITVKKLSIKMGKPSPGSGLILAKNVMTTMLVNYLGSTQNTSINFARTADHPNVLYAHENNVTDTLRIYSGERPDSPSDPVPAAATLLAEVQGVNFDHTGFSYPVYENDEIAAVKTDLSNGEAFNVVASGTPTWFRHSAGSNTRFDGSAGLPGSGAALIVSAPLEENDHLSISSLTFRI